MNENRSAAGTIPGYVDFLTGLVEKLKDIPPPPILACSAMFPRKHALTFADGKQEYMLAHADFWAQIPALKEATSLPLTGLELIDLDNGHNQKMADKVFDAIAKHLDKVDARP